MWSHRAQGQSKLLEFCLTATFTVWWSVSWLFCDCPVCDCLPLSFQGSTKVWIMYIPSFIPALIWGITPKPQYSNLGHCNNCPYKWTVNLRQCKTQPYERQSFGSAHCLMASTFPSFYFFSLSLFLSLSLFIPICFLSSFRSVSLPYCMSCHRKYCRHSADSELYLQAWLERSTSCLKWRIAQESRVICSLHLFFLVFYSLPL